MFKFFKRIKENRIKKDLLEDFSFRLSAVEGVYKDKIAKTQYDVLEEIQLRMLENELNQIVQNSISDFTKKLTEEYGGNFYCFENIKSYASGDVTDDGGKTALIAGTTTAAVAGGVLGGALAKQSSTVCKPLLPFLPKKCGISLEKPAGFALDNAKTINGLTGADTTSFFHIPETISEVVARPLGANPVAVTAAIIAGAAAAVGGLAFLGFKKFSKSEKRKKIKEGLIAAYDNEIRPKLEKWAEEQIDFCIMERLG